MRPSTPNVLAKSIRLNERIRTGIEMQRPADATHTTLMTRACNCSVVLILAQSISFESVWDGTSTLTQCVKRLLCGHTCTPLSDLDSGRSIFASLPLRKLAFFDIYIFISVNSVVPTRSRNLSINWYGLIRMVTKGRRSIYEQILRISEGASPLFMFQNKMAASL